ncbi:MAG: hypothetical protein ACYSXF_05880 [Planctomycetota bacterium]|jgi:hypothetical protein
MLLKMLLGFGAPLVATPVAIYSLRHLFAVFLREGAELFVHTQIAQPLSFEIGKRLALVNVLLLLVSWLGLFACDCLGMPMLAVAGVAIAGLLTTLLVTILMVRSRLDVYGWPAAQVGLLSFVGGNLPLFLIATTLLAFW